MLKNICKLFNNKVFTSLFFILIILNSIYATEENPLNKIPYAYSAPVVGSKAISLGESFTAVADNTDTIYWNPAGVFFLTKKMSFMISITKQSEEKWEDIIKNDPMRGSHFVYFGFANKGMGLSYRQIANFSDFVQSNNTNSEKVQVKINEYTISFSNNMNKDNKMITGMNINLFSGTMGVTKIENNLPSAVISNGMGYGIDWGLIYFINPVLKLGLSFFNLPSKIFWENYTNEELPQIFRAGLSFYMLDLLQFTTEVEKKSGNNLSEKEIYHLGFDQYLGKYFHLRIGMFSDDWNNQNNLTFTSGIGFDKEKVNFDFAVKKYYLEKTDSKPVFDYNITMGMPF